MRKYSAPTTAAQLDQSDGDGEVADNLEGSAGAAEGADDGANVGPDADPNEPGHHDAAGDDAAE